MFGMLGDILFDFGEILSNFWRFWRDLINGFILENVVEKENKSKRDITKGPNRNSFNRMFVCRCTKLIDWVL